MPPTSKYTSPRRILRAVLYLRVSLDRYARLRLKAGAEDRGSIPRQERAGRDLIDHRPDWTLAAVKFDPESASMFAKREREQWPEVLEMIESGQCDVVVLWESSRADRKLTTWSAFLDLCLERGVLIHIMDHDTTYDVRKPRDWEILADEGVRNARESRKISSRMRAAKADLREQGRPEGAITYGYRSVYDPETGILLRREPDEHAAEVRWMFNEFAGGMKVKTLIAEMRARYPHRTWSGSGIRGMLANPRYVALIRDGDELRPAQWEPLVEIEVWRGIQARLEANRAQGWRSAAVRHLCSNLAVAPCGALVNWQRPAPSDSRRHAFYRCGGDRCVGIRADWLDDYVAAKVVAYWANQELRAAREARARASSADLDALRREETRLEDRLKEIGRSSAHLPIQTVVGMTESVAGELAEVQERIKVATPVPLAPLLEGDGLEEVAAAWAALTEAGAIGVQREIVRGTLQHVRVLPRGRGRWREFDPATVDAPYHGG